MNPLQQWRAFQDKSLYYQAVKADGEESCWREIARQYDQLVYPQHQQRALLARLLPRLDGVSSAIEIGAGSGTLTMPLARQFRRMTAVEPSPSMAEVLQGNLVQQRLGHVTIIRQRWEEAQLPPADAVIAGGCLYVFYEIEAALRKMREAARSTVLLTHVGNEGLWDIDLRAQELLAAPKPCLFPPLPLLMDVLTSLRIPATVELFYVTTTKRFTEEQWLKRCQRLFAVRPEQQPLLLDFLRQELHQEHGCWTVTEDVPATIVELRREN
ncbi:MAG: Methyltransferase domain-containing protein [Candidatus Electronema aureum]|uniref:Methyltransferase domain-containing protein n=1 Tax=Candidatus Electronema aureum TaxID=2005002 RepID=A0A521G3R6_9BACT|nr:MAG: Methyltransferase domain-containing protein [Candidatus Electronema aureum]